MRHCVWHLMDSCFLIPRVINETRGILETRCKNNCYQWLPLTSKWTGNGKRAAPASYNHIVRTIALFDGRGLSAQRRHGKERLHKVSAQGPAPLALHRETFPRHWGLPGYTRFPHKVLQGFLYKVPPFWVAFTSGGGVSPVRTSPGSCARPLHKNLFHTRPERFLSRQSLPKHWGSPGCARFSPRGPAPGPAWGWVGGYYIVI